MKTKDIMKAYEYESVGGPILAVPLQDVLDFLKRMQNSLNDVSDDLYEEISSVMEKLKQ